MRRLPRGLEAVRTSLRASASAGGRRGVGGVSWTWTSVKSETCAWAAPSSRALSAASRSIASPGASASRRRAASIRCGSSIPRDASIDGAVESSAAYLLRARGPPARAAPRRRGARTGRRTAHTAFSRRRACGVDRLHARLRTQLGTAVAEVATQCANATRTVPGSSHAANASGPSSAG